MQTERAVFALPSTIRVNVEQRHIDNGVAEACSRCPVALALAEAFPLWRVYVYGITADVYLKKNFMGSWPGGEYSLSFPTRDFIRNFDKGCPVEPFTVELKLWGHLTNEVDSASVEVPVQC